MAYIGQPPFQEFTSVPTKDSFTGDGSTTTFDLAGEVPLGAENALEVFVANVRPVGWFDSLVGMILGVVVFIVVKNFKGFK